MEQNTEVQEELTEQKIFNIVLFGIRKQGGQSLGRINDVLTCLYRSSDGRKCAAGLLIPDKEYEPFMENKPISELFRKGHFHQLRDFRRLVEALQSAHDRGMGLNLPDEKFMPKWEIEMQDLAKSFELVYTPPEPVNEAVV